MGADLYIDKIYNQGRAEREKAFNDACTARNKAQEEGRPEEEIATLQRAVEAAYSAIYDNPGYFRDSYNGSSLSSVCGFSWWRDVIPLLNRRGNLSGKNLRDFLETVRTATVRFRTKEELEAANCSVDDGENSPQAWHKSKLKHRDELVAFLERAIKAKTVVHCSL